MHQRISLRRTAFFWRSLVAGLVIISLPGLTALPAQAQPGPIAGASVAATTDSEASENNGWSEDQTGDQAEQQGEGQTGGSEDTAEAAEVDRESVESNIDKLDLDTLSSAQNAPLNEGADEASEEDGEESSDGNGASGDSSSEDSDGEWKTYDGTESPDEEEQSTEESDGSTEAEELTRENTGSLPESSDLPQDGDRVYWADSGERETDAFTLAALTWTGEAGSMEVWMSARSEGEWTEPTEMPVSHDHRPDAESDEGQQVRGGTEPVFTDAADAIRVWVTTEGDEKPPEDLRIDLIDPGQAPEADAAAAEAPPAIPEQSSPQTGGDAPEGAAEMDTAAAPPRPAIHSRDQWGADESLRDGSPSYGEVQGAVIHHTAGANGYSESQVPSIIRGVYAYHTLGRGWSDIGYNVLIDRFGGIWEGRAGGLDEAVSGAHAANYNHVAFGASMLGTYSTVDPGDAAVEAFEKVIAWKFGVHGVDDPTGTVSYPGLSTEQKISGHRDVGSTGCPGGELHDRLGEISEGVADKMAGSDVPDPEVELSGDSSVNQGEAATLNVSWTRGDENVTGVMNLERRTENGWATSKQIEVANGTGSATVRPSETTTYRLRASSASKPDDVDTSHPEGTSNTHQVTITQEPEVTLSGDQTVTEGEAATLNIGWKHGQTGVTGVMNVERRNADSSWTFVRQVEVSDGTGSTTVQPGTSTTYRLRASSASSPQGVDTSHPEGTSGWHRVTVEPETEPETELTMSGPGAVMQGEPAELSIGWSHDSSEVTGVVSLQRNDGDSWTELREVEVSDGQATTAITPGGNNTYRVQGVSISSPDISTAADSVTSDPIAVRGFAPPSLSLTGPSIVTVGDDPSLDIRWLSGTAGLSGTVDLERRSGGSWVHVREVDVSGGRASTDVPAEPNTTYRLRASSLRGPDGMSIDDTGNASQIYTVAVRSN